MHDSYVDMLSGVHVVEGVVMLLISAFVYDRYRAIQGVYSIHSISLI